MKQENLHIELLSALKAHWKYKVAIGLVLYALICVPYFATSRLIIFPIKEIQPTWLDNMIGFYDITVIGYLSIYLLLAVPPYTMTSKPDLNKYALGILIVGWTGSLIHFFWPTHVPRPDPTNTFFLYQFLVSIEQPYNCIPSLHAAFSIYTALTLNKCALIHLYPKASKSIVWIWCLIILISTLTTKQHMIIDLIPGIVLAIIAYKITF